MNNEQRVYQTIAEHMAMPVSSLHAKQSFVEDIGMDSLDELELVMSIEDEFHIEIDDETAGTFHTVQDVLTYVARVVK